MKKKIQKILNVLVDILVVIILVLSVLTVVVSLSSRDKGVPNIFGKAPMTVLTDSMEPEIMVNDLIISDVVEDPFAEYEVGDIVTFMDAIDGNEALNTHRIVEIVDSEGKKWKKGETKYYRTKGDNKDLTDEKLKSSVDILAVYHGSKIGGVGAVFGALRTQWGFFLIVLLPMIIFFLYEAVRVIINIIGYNKEKALLAAQEVINNSDLTEEQKQKAIEEYLAAQAAKEGKEDKEEKPSESDDKTDEESSEDDQAENNPE